MFIRDITADQLQKRIMTSYDLDTILVLIIKITLS